MHQNLSPHGPPALAQELTEAFFPEPVPDGLAESLAEILRDYVKVVHQPITDLETYHAAVKGQKAFQIVREAIASADAVWAPAGFLGIQFPSYHPRRDWDEASRGLVNCR